MATQLRSVPARYIMRGGEIVELTGYEISPNGTVYRIINDERFLVPQNFDHAGYLLVNICNEYLATDTGYRSLYVQRLVMSSYEYQDWFPGAVADHIDANRANNSLHNLQWLHITANSSKARCLAMLVIDTIDGNETLCESVIETMQITGMSRYAIMKRVNKKFGTERYIIRSAK